MSKTELINLRLRPYCEAKDRDRVEEIEISCNAAGNSNNSNSNNNNDSSDDSSKLSIFTDTLGDPLARVRHYALHHMLVAEIGEETGKIVGVVRAGIKRVVCMHNHAGTPIYTVAAYILGLRVSPYHRRMGVALALVREMEKWSNEHGAEYVYMATGDDNHASINLFTGKLGYRQFRVPYILFQPIYVSEWHLPRKVQIVQVSAEQAESLYCAVFRSAQFFPEDIGAVLRSPLTAGTWIAFHADEVNGRLSSWASISIWRCNEVYKLRLRGVSWATRALATVSRALGRAAHCCGLVLPTFPDLFRRPFGTQVIYGAHASGERGEPLLRALCAHAHNCARAEGCEFVASEVGCSHHDDLLRYNIPHWKCLSASMRDVWCIKRLGAKPNRHQDGDGNRNGDGEGEDWCRLPPSSSLFVDPRDF